MLYKHGPFSFDLNNELAAMRSAGVIEYNFVKEGYGPSLAVTDLGNRIWNVNSQNIRPVVIQVEFIASYFESKDVRYLKKLASAYFATKKSPRDPVFERAKRISDLKPHVDIHAA